MKKCDDKDDVKMSSQHYELKNFRYSNNNVKM